METGDILPTDEARFSAFVSYSHVDSATAKKLHRKIETYKLPKRLRHLQTDGAKGGASDGRVGQIFRDRDDLPAALDLSESVKEALTQSWALIVVCSPAAKASPWVNKEITLFRELHPDRPILAALVAGEPDEAFPEALLEGGEPLAADLRKESDGWRLGLLKLIAGIAELPLDSLVQRDAQRHLRRVMVVTGGTVVALLAMIGMTIFALQSRNEAQQQQAQAEGLIEYMLTDLRDELKGVGRLDVMTDVNERAMDYYEGQGDLSDMSAESLERRARILRAMGEDDLAKEEFSDALDKYRKVHLITDSLLKQKPDDKMRIYWHAQSENFLGLLLGELDKNDTSLKHFINSKTLIDRLSFNSVQNEQWLLQKQDTYGNICSHYLLNKLNSIDALNFCKIATKNSEVLNTINPDDQGGISQLALRYAWQADALIANGKIEEGFAVHRRHISLVEKLVDLDPKNRRWQTQKMQSYMGYANLLNKFDQSIEAQAYIAQSKSIAQRLIEEDGVNKSWKSWLKRISRIEKKF